MRHDLFHPPNRIVPPPPKRPRRFLKAFSIGMAVLSGNAAGILVIAPLGPCNHSLFQWICALIILIPAWILSILFGGSGAISDTILIIAAGAIQALMFLLLYARVAKVDKRNAAEARAISNYLKSEEQIGNKTIQ